MSIQWGEGKKKEKKKEKEEKERTFGFIGLKFTAF